MGDTPDIVKELKKEEQLNNSFFKKNKKKIGRKKILIVDDDPGVRLAVKTALEENSDYEITDVKSGKECLEKLKAGKEPDLILLDIMMPNMNGWDVAAEIRKNDRWDKIPILFLTAKSDFNSKNYGSIVSNDYITKPFDTDDLKKRIDDNLN